MVFSKDNLVICIIILSVFDFWLSNSSHSSNCWRYNSEHDDILPCSLQLSGETDNKNYYILFCKVIRNA